MKALLISLVMGLYSLSTLVYAQGVQSVRPWLGIELEDGSVGVRIKNVIPDTPAMKAGLQAMDEVTEVSGEKVKTPAELIKAVGSKGVGFTVTVKFMRAGAAMSKDITLVAMPDLLDVAKKNFMNKPAPQFKPVVLRTKDKKKNKTYSIGGSKDRPVLLEFWATWCIACVQAHPTVLEFARKNAGKIDVVAVASDKIPLQKRYFEGLSKHVLEKDDPIIYVFDDKGEINQKFMVPAIPMFILIDKTGNVVAMDVGAGSVLAEIIKKAQTLF